MLHSPLPEGGEWKIELDYHLAHNNTKRNKLL